MREKGGVQVLRYEEPVFRPPSEARSLILQATVGCSHNRCTFCSMYKGKRFRVRPLEEVKREIEWAAKEYPFVKRVFIADGDPMVLDTGHLTEILKELYSHLPALERVAIYATPQNLLEKSPEELATLRNEGLQMVYLGIESGDDQVLAETRKGVDSRQMVEACRKAINAGFTLSTMVILGLGGKERFREHITNTARVVNEIDPHYLAALTLMVFPKTILHQRVKTGRFSMPTMRQIMEEMAMLVGMVEVKTVFRSNHVSNLLPIGGTLPRDREEVLRKIKEAMHLTPDTPLPIEYQGAF